MNVVNLKDFKGLISKLNIDLLISSASFENRCFVIAKETENLPIKKRIFFYNSNEDASIVQNAKKLMTLGQNSNDCALNSDEPIENYQKIHSILQNTIQEFKRPNLLIDSTTFTHESILVLLRLIELNKESLGSVFISYVTAKEYSTNISNPKDKWLSKGIKEVRTILGYSGYTDPIFKNHLMILFGFEYNRTRQLIEEYDFDEITLGFGGTPINENHYKINFERHQRLLKEYKNAKEFNFSLVDFNLTKEGILNYITENGYDKYNNVLAPLNNKISTIGAGLAAIENMNIQLAYAKPMFYNSNGYSEKGSQIYIEELKFT